MDGDTANGWSAGIHLKDNPYMYEWRLKSMEINNWSIDPRGFHGTIDEFNSKYKGKYKIIFTFGRA